jgi:hypothetical protein
MKKKKKNLHARGTGAGFADAHLLPKGGKGVAAGHEVLT